jgi:hypothetical protein
VGKIAARRIRVGIAPRDFAHAIAPNDAMPTLR